MPNNNNDVEKRLWSAADELRANSRMRAAVQVAIRDILDKLPEVYGNDLYQQKREVVYQHVYDSYYGAGKSIYARLGV